LDKGQPFAARKKILDLQGHQSSVSISIELSALLAEADTLLFEDAVWRAKSGRWAEAWNLSRHLDAFAPQSIRSQADDLQATAIRNILEDAQGASDRGDKPQSTTWFVR